MPNVQVFVRCRPALSKEADAAQGAIGVDDDGSQIIVSGGGIGGGESSAARAFHFDRVFSDATSQHDVFLSIAPLVDRVIEGVHATVFAYGQTGSGKTYTMEGLRYEHRGVGGQPTVDIHTAAESHGVSLRLIQLMYEKVTSRAAHNRRFGYRLRCSGMQLYNEKVYDLLSPTLREGFGIGNDPGLPIRWIRGDQFVVENLFVCDCNSPKKMRELYFRCAKEKAMGSHALNMQSSRSHCLFTIYLQTWDTAHPNETVVRSELVLVDLAGSEKLLHLSRDPSAQLVRESIDINASLLTLGKVITSLASSAENGLRGPSLSKSGKQGSKKKMRPHIPYRDSKLTKLLKHALGGNSVTIMIACISPLNAHVDETLSTLLYAGRARNITNITRINEDPKSSMIRKLREEIRGLREELENVRCLASNSVTKHHVVPKGVEDADSEDAAGNVGVAEQVAERLLEACQLLQQLLNVNGQLRTAFDELHVQKEALEVREEALNAENTQLRERIEMLESIALQDSPKRASTRRRHFSSGASPEPRDQNYCRAHSSTRRQSSEGCCTPTPRPATAAPAAPPAWDSTVSSSPPKLNPALALAERPIRTPKLTRDRLEYAARLKEYQQRYCHPFRPPSYEAYYRQPPPASHSAFPSLLTTSTGLQSRSAPPRDAAEALLRRVAQAFGKDVGGDDGGKRGVATEASSAAGLWRHSGGEQKHTLHAPALKDASQIIPASALRRVQEGFGALDFGRVGEAAGARDGELRELEERRRRRQQRQWELQQRHLEMQQRGTAGVPPLSDAAPPSKDAAATTAWSLGGAAACAPTNARTTTEWPKERPIGAGEGGHAERLFQYLSKEESEAAAAAERLRLRALQHATWSSSS